MDARWLRERSISTIRIRRLPSSRLTVPNPSPEDIELGCSASCPNGRQRRKDGRSSASAAECSLLQRPGGILFARTRWNCRRGRGQTGSGVAGSRGLRCGDSGAPDSRFQPLPARRWLRSTQRSKKAESEPTLFERLSLVRIDVPALRQRREDIPVLALEFLKDAGSMDPLKTLRTGDYSL